MWPLGVSGKMCFWVLGPETLEWDGQGAGHVSHDKLSHMIKMGIDASDICDLFFFFFRKQQSLFGPKI